MLHQYKGERPQIGKDVYLAPGSRIIGKVVLADQASIWHNAVLRGDLASIKVGKKTNIQENSTLHVDRDYPLTIGNNITVGHGAILHSCTIGDNCLIGMGATILNGVVIGPQSIIGAGALVPENREIPAQSLVLGVPGKVIRQLTPTELKRLQQSADHYYQLAADYLAQGDG